MKSDGTVVIEGRRFEIYGSHDFHSQIQVLARGIPFHSPRPALHSLGLTALLNSINASLDDGGNMLLELVFRQCRTLARSLSQVLVDVLRSERRMCGVSRALHNLRTAAFWVPSGPLRVYFADPHSPWQRGSNENTNGLLRHYLPKGTDLSGLTQEELDAIAWKLNTRPRKLHGFRSPIEVYDEPALLLGASSP